MPARQPSSRLWAIAIAALAVAGTLARTARAEEPDANLAAILTVTSDVRRVDATVNGCAVALEQQAGMPTQRLYLRYRNECDQPFETKLGLLTSMAQVLIGTEQPSQGITLFVGRVVQTFPDMARQVAQAAEAGSWDATRRTETGYANKLFAQLVAETDAAKDLEVALGPWRLKRSGASVEKVLVAPPAQTPFAEALSGSDPVPFDGLTHLRFDPIPE